MGEVPLVWRSEEVVEDLGHEWLGLSVKRLWRTPRDDRFLNAALKARVAIGRRRFVPYAAHALMARTHTHTHTHTHTRARARAPFDHSAGPIPCGASRDRRRRVAPRLFDDAL